MRGGEKNFLKYAKQTKNMYFFRLWFAPVTRCYGIDSINLGMDFSPVNDNNFQWIFNPKFPLAYVQFKEHFWILVLPGKRRSVQGQILYHQLTSNHWESFEAGQWSPEGNFFLSLRKQISRNSQNVRPNPSAYALLGDLYVVEDKRCRLSFKKLTGSEILLSHSHGHHQLSSKFWSKKKTVAKIFDVCIKNKLLKKISDNLWTGNNSFLWCNKLDSPLYECFVTQNGGSTTLEKKTILNKAGHCRLIMYPHCDVSNPVDYSSK